MPRARIFAAKNQHGGSRRLQIVLHILKVPFDNGVPRVGVETCKGNMWYDTGLEIFCFFLYSFKIGFYPFFYFLHVFCISSTRRLNVCIVQVTCTIHPIPVRRLIFKLNTYMGLNINDTLNAAWRMIYKLEYSHYTHYFLVFQLSRLSFSYALIGIGRDAPFEMATAYAMMGEWRLPVHT